MALFGFEQALCFLVSLYSVCKSRAQEFYKLKLSLFLYLQYYGMIILGVKMIINRTEESKK